MMFILRFSQNLLNMILKKVVMYLSKLESIASTHGIVYSRINTYADSCLKPLSDEWNFMFESGDSSGLKTWDFYLTILKKNHSSFPEH